jgi:hypothetical protein
MNNLGERLHEVADRIIVPPHHIDDDLARGRRRQAKRRLAAGTLMLLAVPAIVGVAVNSPGFDLPRNTHTAADSGSAGEVRTGPIDGDTESTYPDKDRAHQISRKLTEVVAEVLDPNDEHIDVLQPTGKSHQWKGKGAFKLAETTTVGAQVDWIDAGRERALGAVWIEVSTKAPKSCDDCEPVPTPDGDSALLDRTLEDQVGLAPGSWKLTYARPDGLTVTVTVGDFVRVPGGDPSPNVIDVDVTPAQVAELVVDPRLAVLPADWTP